jgi:hypothetical protein
MRFRSLLRSPSEIAIWKDLAIDTHAVRSDLVLALFTDRTPFRVLAASKHAALTAFFRVGMVGTAGQVGHNEVMRISIFLLLFALNLYIAIGPTMPPDPWAGIL